MPITLLGTSHVLFLGGSNIGPEVPPAVREAPIREFQTYYSGRVVVGFHVMGPNSTPTSELCHVPGFHAVHSPSKQEECIDIKFFGAFEE